MIRKAAWLLALSSSVAFAAPGEINQQTIVLLKVLEKQAETLEAIKAQNEILKEQNRIMNEQLYAVKALLVTSRDR